MADIGEKNAHQLALVARVEELKARIDEDMAFLYATFMTKLLKSEPGKHSTVIEEYIGDRFDVRARWYLCAVQSERQIESYVGIISFVGKKDTKAVKEHFASSLSHGELVDARIEGRIWHWKAEAMRRVREIAAAKQRDSVSATRQTAAGSSDTAPRDPSWDATPCVAQAAEATEIAKEGFEEAAVTPQTTPPQTTGQDSGTAVTTKSDDSVLDRQEGVALPQEATKEAQTEAPVSNESGGQAAQQSPLAELVQAVIADGAPEDPEYRLSQFLEKHPGTNLADIKYSAGVYTAEFQDWRRGQLKRDSVMSIRIEKVLNGATPLTKKPPRTGSE